MGKISLESGGWHDISKEPVPDYKEGLLVLKLESGTIISINDDLSDYMELVTHWKLVI
jgi:hypothetical protein